MKKIFLYQNKKIAYHLYGNGRPVMLVHGFGEDAGIWQNQIEFLKNKYQVIVPDLPGTGESEMISDMSIEGMAEVLHAVIHEENIETCTVIGHSMGGYITLAIADKYWNHINAFGLLHSTAFADTEEKKATREKGIKFISRHGAFEFLKTTTPNLFSENSRLFIPKTIEIFINSLSKLTTESLIAYYKAMINRPKRTEVLEHTQVPVLFIAGEHDIAVPFSDSLKQCHLPEKCYFHILSGSGHMGMLEETDKVNRILEGFFSGN